MNTDTHNKDNKMARFQTDKMKKGRGRGRIDKGWMETMDFSHREVENLFRAHTNLRCIVFDDLTVLASVSCARYLTQIEIDDIIDSIDCAD